MCSLNALHGLTSEAHRNFKTTFGLPNEVENSETKSGKLNWTSQEMIIFPLALQKSVGSTLAVDILVATSVLFLGQSGYRTRVISRLSM